MRSDPALCFRALCGEEPCGTKKKKKRMAKKALQAARRALDVAKARGADFVVPREDSDMSESGEDTEGEEVEESGTLAMVTPKRMCVCACTPLSSDP